MAGIHEPDLRTLIEAVEEMTANLDGPAVPWTLLTVLNRLISCEEIGFSEVNHRRRRFISAQYIEGAVTGFEGEKEAASEPWWALAAATKTAAHPRMSPPGGIRRWSAQYTRAEIRSSPLYQEYWRGVGDLMAVYFPAPAGCTRRLLLWRGTPDRFTGRDEAVVRLLGPHLFEIDRLARRQRDGSPTLTTREWQVLELVAQGASNAEIAAALVMSVATVRKHMEHIFDRSGVRTRSAAVARLIPICSTG